MIQLSLFDIEYWKPIPGFDDRYEASNLGRIRSLWASVGCRPVLRWRIKIISPYASSVGYMTVKVHFNQKQRTTGVHQLVALAFIGPCPEGQEVNHIDRNKSNNRPENLEYLTHAENIQHARQSGGWSYVPRGENTARAKLTEGDVRHIRLLLADGQSHRKIARAYGVSQVAITCINTGKTWSHVK